MKGLKVFVDNLANKINQPHYLEIELRKVFDTGVKYGQKELQWNDIETKKPRATERGEWDGLRSEPFIGLDKYGIPHILIMYEGRIDGSIFCDFYDQRDVKIKNIIQWIEIPSID